MPIHAYLANRLILLLFVIKKLLQVPCKPSSNLADNLEAIILDLSHIIYLLESLALSQVAPIKILLVLVLLACSLIIDDPFDCNIHRPFLHDAKPFLPFVLLKTINQISKHGGPALRSHAYLKFIGMIAHKLILHI